VLNAVVLLMVSFVIWVVITTGKKRKVKALVVTPTRELAIQIDENFKAYSKYRFTIQNPLCNSAVWGDFFWK
jgi:superfamily II DNA/RNA helicase